MSWWWSAQRVSISFSPKQGQIWRRKVHTVLARKQGLAAKHLGQNAAHRPDIDRLGVLLKRQHDLGSTVPTGGHVFRHETGVVLLGRRRARQAKVAHL